MGGKTKESLESYIKLLESLQQFLESQKHNYLLSTTSENKDTSLTSTVYIQYSSASSYPNGNPLVYNVTVIGRQTDVCTTEEYCNLSLKYSSL